MNKGNVFWGIAALI